VRADRSAEPEGLTARLAAARQRFGHEACAACGDGGPIPLGLRWEPDGEDAVAAAFRPQPWMQSYDGQLHGGIIALALDAAMTVCLLSRGVPGVTARLDLRYRHPAAVSGRYRVRAALVRRGGRVYRLTAELTGDGRRYADAEAAFVDRRTA